MRMPVEGSRAVVRVSDTPQGDDFGQDYEVAVVAVWEDGLLIDQRGGHIPVSWIAQVRFIDGTGPCGDDSAFLSPRDPTGRSGTLLSRTMTVHVSPVDLRDGHAVVAWDKILRIADMRSST